jgi:cell division septation protein DedD
MDLYIPEEQRREGLILADAMGVGTAPTIGEAALAHASPAPAPMPAAIPAARPASRPAPIIAAVEGPVARPPVRKSEPRPRAEPAAQPAPVAAPTPAGSGRWRVQLGAFRDHGRAQALWKTLNGKVSGLSAFQPYYVTANGLMRLLAGPLGSAADAQRLCARIKPTGTPCVALSI